MSRPLRIHAPGVPMHAMSRGNNKECLFHDHRDYRMYFDMLEEGLERFDVECNGFCAMWNHAHLVLTPQEQPIASLMHQVNSSYCGWFNRRHGRVGHVTQGRYKGLLIEDGYYFLNATRYIALNPVAAGLVTDPADWEWSSYADTIGRTHRWRFLSLDRLWHMLDAEGETDGRERLALFMAAEGPFEYDWSGVIRGGPEFTARLRPLVQSHEDNIEFPYAQRFATRPPLEELFADSLDVWEMEDAVYLAFARHAYTLKAIGAHLGIHPSTVWSWARRSQLRNGSFRSEGPGVRSLFSTKKEI